MYIYIYICIYIYIFVYTVALIHDTQARPEGRATGAICPGPPAREGPPNYIASLLCRVSVDLRPYENLRYHFTCKTKLKHFHLEHPYIEFIRNMACEMFAS